MLTIKSPIGPINLYATEQGLAVVAFDVHKNNESYTQALARRWGRQWVEADHEILKQAAQQLEEYFAGQCSTFDVPLDLLGTEFQQSVWMTLLKIPKGDTWSYKQQAASMGKPTACRAVAAANGQNPISIIVPCHRVIGSDGSLTGYASGLDRKRWLLQHEGYL